MSYVVNRYNTNVLTVVDDYTIDETVDLKLVGRHYVDYGEIQNENFVFLLENFANTIAPPKSISGQLWYDTNKNKIKVFDGSRYATVGLPTVDSMPPVNQEPGELWWDSENNQLYIYDGYDTVLVGPETDRSNDINFDWDETEKSLSVIIDVTGESVRIGPNTTEMLALSHILG